MQNHSKGHFSFAGRDRGGNSLPQTNDWKYAMPAGCLPENVTVPVPLNKTSDPNVFVFPSCIRIQRCGGCCNNALLECQPTLLVTEKLAVTQITLQGAK